MGRHCRLNISHPDENFIIEHSHRGMLSMVNSGPHSNFTKFMILFAGHMPYFDRKYVAFGRVIEGEETLAKLEAVETRFERPKRFITIAKSGSYREILESSS